MNIKEHKIMLVDDESEILAHVKRALEKEGFYRVITASDVAEAKRLLEAEKPHLLVLDVVLPDGDGFEILQYARRNSYVPAIFLTARDEDDDKLVGLGLGADDYITKPFLMKELIYRITNVLRRTYRTETLANQVLRLGEVTVDFSQNLVIRDGSCVSMTAMEREILAKLCENRNRVVTKDAIADAIWGDEIIGNEQSLMMHIRRIRMKIEENPSAPRYLLTVKGIGYRLKTDD